MNIVFCYTDLPGQKKLLILPRVEPLADIPNPSGVKYRESIPNYSHLRE
jgi:hypothetical protein